MFGRIAEMVFLGVLFMWSSTSPATAGTAGTAASKAAGAFEMGHTAGHATEAVAKVIELKQRIDERDKLIQAALDTLPSNREKAKCNDALLGKTGK